MRGTVKDIRNLSGENKKKRMKFLPRFEHVN